MSRTGRTVRQHPFEEERSTVIKEEEEDVDIESLFLDTEEVDSHWHIQRGEVVRAAHVWATSLGLWWKGLPGSMV